LSNTINQITTLQASNNLSGEYYNDVNSALANSLSILNAQYAYIGNDNSAWASALQTWQTLDQTASAQQELIPWIAQVYPDEYPEYTDAVISYNGLQQDSDSALLTFQNLSQINFSVADMVNVQMSFIEGLTNVLSASIMTSDVDSYITGALAAYQQAKLAPGIAKNTLVYRMTNAARQTKLSNSLLIAQQRMLSLTPTIRLQLTNADQAAGVTTLQDLADGIDKDYSTKLLDLYKTYSIYTNTLGTLIQSG
jgi:hypothetical protein